ncbi:MAG TPA: 3-isopropylmalate dehydratase small subunit [Polyangiaceae bacterium]|nr:3-isopropylmalate dehydratase small subunit [Polyangiaceae bacterium]
MEESKRDVIAGRGVVVRGNDIDTDRIVPARFLKSVVFDGLGAHAFEDDRAQLRSVGRTHPFDDARFAGAHILLVGKNFGCGSSREHAPQALLRWGSGIRAIVGESFAEIFRDNCVALGIPCVVVDPADAEALASAVEQSPALELSVDLRSKTIAAGASRHPFEIAEGPRRQLLEGRWDSTAELLASKERILELAERIPYLKAYA